MVTAVGLVAAGCGQGFDREAAVSSFGEANPDVTTAQAECVVDRLIDRYGLGELEQELRNDPPDERFEEAQFRDMFACGVQGDVTDQVVEQLEANGVTEEYAPCVADHLVGDLTDGDIDVLLSGEITDEFFEKFVGAMEDCGAVNA